ncbi:MAG: hypothetical protein WC326_02255 [Candidatus Delongbacteria bacterium]
MSRLFPLPLGLCGPLGCTALDDSDQGGDLARPAGLTLRVGPIS